MDQKQYAQKIRNYIENRQNDLIESLSTLVRQPSISSGGEGVEECCDLIIRTMQDIGIEAVKHAVKPYPVITGWLGNDPGKKTVLIYAHYDVQPVGKESLWKTPPFEPTIIDGKIYGRGTADNKGPLAAHLNAVKFWVDECGEPPVNIKFIFEGCEENGSTGLEQFLEGNRDLLKADVVYFSDGSKNHNDTPIIALGVKGAVHAELILTTMTRDVHSQYAPVLPSAAWEMIELLGKLRTADGRCAIPGFYDDVVPPTPEEKAIYNELPDVRDDLYATYGAYPSYPEEEGYYAHLNGTPSFNINGMTSGYTGEGGATILTSKAMVRFDMRTVKNQDGGKIIESLRKFIRELGYDNVEVNASYIPPAKTPLSTPFLPAVQRAVMDTFGKAMVYPNRPSTAPDYLWSEVLGIPTIQVRWCDYDSDNHAPNEHLTLSNYFRGTELTSTALYEISRL